jgi:asparagine synthase (glutamine-hydrolysing)
LDDVEKSGFDYAYARRLIAFSNDLKNKFYSEEMKEKVQNSDCLALVRDIWSSAGDICLLEKMLATDFNLYLPDVLMVKMDIACMANSLEARSPFLDNEFVELVASFPADLKVRRMTSKYILKRKLKGFLPEEIISRKKMGFGIPVGRWFRKELKQFVNEILLDNASLSRGYFDPQAVMKMVEDHTSGRIDHTSRIWLLIILEMWHKIFVDRKNF